MAQWLSIWNNDEEACSAMAVRLCRQRAANSGHSLFYVAEARIPDAGTLKWDADTVFGNDARRNEPLESQHCSGAKGSFAGDRAVSAPLGSFVEPARTESA